MALEVLSYHTAVTEDETNEILQQIANDEEDPGGNIVVKKHHRHHDSSLRDFHFSDFDQSDVATVKLALTMFKDFKASRAVLVVVVGIVLSRWNLSWVCCVSSLQAGGEGGEKQ